MRTALAYLLLILVLYTRTASGQQAAEIDSFMASVRQHQTAASDSMNTVVIDAVEYKRKMDSKWRVDGEEIWTKRIYVKDPDFYHEDILSVIEDGKPWDEKKIRKELSSRNKEFAKDRKKQKEERDFCGPLDSSYYSDYEFHREGSATRNGIALDSISFKSKIRDDKHVDGYLVVDTRNFNVHYMEFALADRPTGVKMLKIAMEFSEQPNGFTLPWRTTFRGHFGLLFIGGRRENVQEHKYLQFNAELPDSIFAQPYDYKPETR